MKRRLVKTTVGMCAILTLAMLFSVPAFAKEKVIELTINDHNPPPSTVAQSCRAKTMRRGQELEKGIAPA